MIDKLREMFEKKVMLPEVINSVMMACLREYHALGGMPEVIDDYLQKKL